MCAYCARFGTDAGWLSGPKTRGGRGGKWLEGYGENGKILEENSGLEARGGCQRMWQPQKPGHNLPLCLTEQEGENQRKAAGKMAALGRGKWGGGGSGWCLGQPQTNKHSRATETAQTQRERERVAVSAAVSAAASVSVSVSPLLCI